jgi:hypothetical protein
MRGDAGSKSRSVSNRVFLFTGKFYSKLNFTKSKSNKHKKMARPDDESNESDGLRFREAEEIKLNNQSVS